MNHTDRTTLHIRDIQRIFLEDQHLLDKAIAALKARHSLDKDKQSRHSGRRPQSLRP